MIAQIQLSYIAAAMHPSRSSGPLATWGEVERTNAAPVIFVNFAGAAA